MNKASARIVLIEDEPSIRKLLRIGLGAYGYEVIEAQNGQQGLQLCALEMPDLIILDIGLPDIDGQQILAQLREWTNIPVIMLSVRDHEEDKVHALDAGANDYVVKPFSVKELEARIRVSLRSRGEIGESPLKAGDLEVDLGQNRVTRGGKLISLTRKEFGLLRVLVRYPGRVVTQRQLLEEVWGPGHAQDSHYLRIYIGHLRQKLGDDPAQPHLIITEPGIGYRLFIPGADA